MAAQLIVYISNDEIAAHLVANPEALMEVLTGLTFALDDADRRARYVAFVAEADGGSLAERAVPAFLRELELQLRPDRGVL